MKDKQKLKKSIFKLSLSLIIIVAILAISYVVLDYYNLTNISKEQLHQMIASTGAWGPLVYMLIVFLQVTIIPLPGVVVILAGNLMFGFWLTLLYCFIATMIGSIVSFFLGRLIGRRFVNWIVGDKEVVDSYLKKVRGKEFVVFFFMFLLPVFPDDALCAVAGISKLKYSEFIFMQLISRPLSILSTLIFMSGDIIPFKGWGLVIIILIGIASIIAFIFCYKNADKITSYFRRITKR